MPSREHYEALWRALPQGLEPERFALRRAFLLERVSAGQRVLDLGCGEAHFAAELAQAGAEVVGADVAEHALRRARARHPQLELTLLPAQGPWPLADASFDAVWAGEVIEHVADTAAWMSELRRVLRPGGRLLLSTPANAPPSLLRAALSPRAFAARFDPLGEHLRFYSARTLRALLSDLGFEEISVRRAGRVPGARAQLLAQATRTRF